MDPAGTGALIGIGVMVLLCVGVKLSEIYGNRKNKKELIVTSSSPLLIHKKQWKVKDLFKTNKTLTKMSGSRILLTSIDDSVKIPV